MVASPASFEASHHQLAPSLALTLLQPHEPLELGEMFASIDPWARYPFTPADLTRFFAAVEPGAPRFAIRVDGALQGGLVVRTNWLRGPYIHMLGLAPAVQGQGLGSALLAFIEQVARLTGERNVWVAASDFNTHAQRFYERFGFKRVAELDGLVRDERTEFLYRKRLGDPAKEPTGSVP